MPNSLCTRCKRVLPQRPGHALHGAVSHVCGKGINSHPIWMSAPEQKDHFDEYQSE